jgi:hypothetical protein
MDLGQLFKYYLSMFNPKEGNDLYIVYNELLNCNRTRVSPILPLSDTRTLLVKYTYTFSL